MLNYFSLLYMSLPRIVLCYVEVIWWYAYFVVFCGLLLMNNWWWYNKTSMDCAHRTMARCSVPWIVLQLPTPIIFFPNPSQFLWISGTVWVSGVSFGLGQCCVSCSAASFTVAVALHGSPYLWNVVMMWWRQLCVVHFHFVVVNWNVIICTSV